MRIHTWGHPGMRLTIDVGLTSRSSSPYQAVTGWRGASVMRLGVSRRRRARLSPPGGVSRACVAVAAGTLLVIALSGASGAGVLGPTGASGPPRYVSLGDSYTAG